MTYPEVPLDLVTRLFIDGEWTDITSDVRGPSVDITGRGTASEQSNPRTYTTALMLNDRQGKYVDQNPNSIYFDKLGANVPLRVSVRPHHVSGPLSDVTDTFTRADNPIPLNANPSFETGDTTGWSGLNCSIVASTAWASDGTYSCFVTPDGVNAIGGVHSDMLSGLTPGNTYMFIYRIKVTNSILVSAAINWHDSGAVFLSTTFGPAVTLSAGTEALLAVTGTAPVGATRAVLRARYDGTPAITDTFYVDEAIVTDVTSGGWGQPDTGQPAYIGWGGGGSIYSSHFRIRNGTGTHLVPQANAYRVSGLESISCLDFDSTVTFTCPQAVGGSLEPANIMFHGQGFTGALARVRVTTTNTVECLVIDRDGTTVAVTTVPSLTHLGTSQFLKLRTLVLGHDVFMKVWVATDPQPDAWHLHGILTSPPEYGYTALRSGVAAGNTNISPVEFTYDDLTFTIEDPRACTEVAEWPAKWDSTGTDVYIPIVGAGLRRRLNKGQKPLRSAHTRAILAASTPPDAYWPLEDSSDASIASSGINNGSPMVPAEGTSPPSFGDTGTILGSSSSANFSDGGTLVGVNDNYVFKGVEWAIDFVVAIDGPSNGAFTSTLVIEWSTGGTSARFECHCSNNDITVKHFSANGAQIGEAVAANTTVFSKQTKHIRYHSIQDGLNYLSRLYVDGVLADTADNGGSPIPGLVREITSVIINPLDANGIFVPSAVNQVVVWGANPADVTDMASAAHGYVGEKAADRLVRLGNENGFTVDIRGAASESAAMGPQPTDTLLNIMDLTAETDLGLLYESRYMLGFEFKTRASIYNATGLDLSYSSKLFSDELAPTTDDKLLVNSVIANRYGGGEYTYSLEEGKRSIQDYPNGAGLYQIPLDFNTESVAGLVAPAQFTVARGTVLDRVSKIKVNLARTVFSANPSLTAQILALDLLHRLNIIDLPAWLPPKDYRVLIQGYSEIINGLGNWDVEWNTVPYDPFQAAIWETSRYDTDSSVTNSAITSGTTTSFEVVTATGKYRWVAGSGSSFPIKVKIAGVVFNVTAISGLTNTQVFTVDAVPLNGVIKSIPVGSKVSLADPDYWSY